MTITQAQQLNNHKLSSEKSTANTPPSERYANQSVLKSGNWSKISVAESGLHKLTYEQIKQMGHDPATVRIFGYGGAMLNENFSQTFIDDLPEVSIAIYTGNDNQFGPGDYIIFYAQGPISWQYSATNKSSTPFFHHIQNCYSTKGYYFVTSGKTQKIIEQATPETANTSEIITSFTDHLVHELDSINFINSGREWFGEELNSNRHSRAIGFSIHNILNETAIMQFAAAARGTSASILTVTSNNTSNTIGSLSIAARNAASTYEYARTDTAFWQFSPGSGSGQGFTITNSNTSSTAWINFIELNITRSLTIHNNEPLYFRMEKQIGENKITTFQIQGANSNTQVWDISTPYEATRLPSNYINGILSFTTSTNTLREFVALDPSQISLNAEIVGRVDNQNLHALPATDYIIISNTEFIDEAERLANAHRHDLSVEVVDAEAVYNEFSSGTPDATAYRRFMKMFYDRGEAPKYLLLFGDGCFDNRNLLPRATDVNIRRLLTYESYNSVYEGVSYVSDDYFAFLEDHEGSMNSAHTMDIGVGRFPVNTIEQARIAVDKTINYMNNTPNKWRNEVLFLADDGDYNEHIMSADSVARQTSRENPELLIRKLYFDAYKQEVTATGERYPEVETLFDNYIKTGTLITNYMGHGGYTGWSNEAVLNTEKIINMYNEHYPLYVTATCDFAGYDDFKATAGEQLFRNSHGGTMALFTTTRSVYANPNLILNLHIMHYLFDKDSLGMPRRLGEVMMLAKNQQLNTTNKFAFTLLGDPALRLTYPFEYNVRTDSINHISINDTIANDTISALSEVTLHGYIEDKENTTKLHNFNGTVYVNIFDKEDVITTLCNDIADESLKQPFTFKYRANPIYCGSAAVTNGEFEVTFMVPKDIRYNYGTGRIVYYAQNNDETMDANGAFEKFIIGGENTNAPIDTEGPQVNMYLNTPDFKSGDNVPNKSLFVAKVYDESGINTLGNGIGHDIILRINGETADEIVLNNFYTSELGSYKNGTVAYELPSLPEGTHHLLFRVWDLQNNSTTDSLTFTVDYSKKPKITNLFTYPNPAHVGQTINLVYEHDRPGALLTANISLHAVNGATLLNTQQTIITNNSNQSLIEWTLPNNMTEGIYLLRLQIFDENDLYAVKSTKISITR
ncbi:MAG: type IX secretion system sortase PorU [Bacteroidales bacterium]|nr:type IX secretion system sortase PorU [Bacteroidales bacterium]